jgi:hypothetical protein
MSSHNINDQTMLFSFTPPSTIEPISQSVSQPVSGMTNTTSTEPSTAKNVYTIVPNPIVVTPENIHLYTIP